MNEVNPNDLLKRAEENVNILIKRFEELKAETLIK
jgi:hypothetical protein